MLTEVLVGIGEHELSESLLPRDRCEGGHHRRDERGVRGVVDDSRGR